MKRKEQIVLHLDLFFHHVIKNITYVTILQDKLVKQTLMFIIQ